MNKKQLYEQIMKSVSQELKKALNETLNQTISKIDAIKLLAHNCQNQTLEFDFSDMDDDDMIEMDECWNGYMEVPYYLVAIDENGNCYSCPEDDFDDYKCYNPENIDDLPEGIIDDIWSNIQKYNDTSILQNYNVM